MSEQDTQVAEVAESQVAEGDAAESVAVEEAPPENARSVAEQAVREARETLSAQQSDDAEGVAASDAASDAPSPERKSDFILTRDGEEIAFDEARAGERVRYKAKGEEKERSLDEVVRLAQIGEGASTKIEDLRTQRNTLANELQETQSKAQQLVKDRATFMRVLSDESGEAFRKLQKEFLQRRGTPGAGDQGQDNARPEPRSDAPDPRVQAGQRFVAEQLVPHAERLAESYGADAQEIVKATLYELSQEPPRFLTREVVEEIVNERVPRQLEAAGYSAKDDVPRFTPTARTQRGPITPKESRNGNASELEKENARLREQLEAAQGKSEVSKAKKSPPSASSSATPKGAENALIDEEKITSLEESKKQLRALQRRGGKN